MPQVPANAQELFNTQVPEAIAKSPDKAKEIGAVYLFKITGDDGGTWTVDLVSSPPTCQPGAHGTPQCTIECADADLRSMVEGGMQAAMSLFFSGKLKVSGDPSLATRLTKLLQMAS